jgi:ubiquinone/menaquinone biosynthesis C-methylase UbiE
LLYNKYLKIVDYIFLYRLIWQKIMRNIEKQKYFDRYARSCDSANDDGVILRLEELFDSMQIWRGERIADLGCGTGVLFPLLLPRIDSVGRLYAYDFSPGMIARAKERYSAPNLEIVLADAHELPAEDDFFHRVICFASFAHFDFKQDTLDEIHRVLRPGGTAYIIHLLSSTEIAHHHKDPGTPIEHDTLPDEADFDAMVDSSGLILESYIDRPGLYKAVMRKI